MDRISPAAIAAALLTAPAWARVGLTMRDERMRSRAADALASDIVDRIDGRERANPNQLTLPIA